MTTIRTGNNRRRAKAKHAAVMGRKRYAALDFETCGLPMTSEEILASNARMVYFDERPPEMISLDVTSNESIEAIARTIDAFVNDTRSISGLSRFADYGPEVFVNRGDNANPTSVASEVEKLRAMIHADPMLSSVATSFPRRWERSDDRISFERMVLQDALTEAERFVIEDTMAMFAKPDEGISPEHAEYMNSMPSLDEFVESLPDGLPDDQPKG